MNMNDVEFLVTQQLSERGDPSRVPRIVDPETSGRDPDLFQRPDQGVLPRQDVTDPELESSVIGASRGRNEKMLGAARTEALDEPQHLDRRRV